MRETPAALTSIITAAWSRSAWQRNGRHSTLAAAAAGAKPPVPGRPLKFGTFRPGLSLCLGPPASAGGKKGQHHENDQRSIRYI
jgi:hypothetical protein